MMAAAYLPYIMRDPSTQTYRRGVAQPGSAPPWGGGGRRFKSSRPDHSDHSYLPFLVQLLVLLGARATAVFSNPLWSSRATREAEAQARRGERGNASVRRRDREVASAHPLMRRTRREGTGEAGADQGVRFLLVTFLCVNKEKSPRVQGRRHPQLAFHNARSARDTITR